MAKNGKKESILDSQELESTPRYVPTPSSDPIGPINSNSRLHQSNFGAAVPQRELSALFDDDAICRAFERKSDPTVQSAHCTRSKVLRKEQQKNPPSE